MEEELLVFLIYLAVLDLNERPGKLLSFELGQDHPSRSHLIGVFHLVLLKDEGMLYGNTLCLSDTVLYAFITISAHRALHSENLA